MVWILNQHSKRSGSVSLDKWLSPHWTGGSAAKEYSNKIRNKEPLTEEEITELMILPLTVKGTAKKQYYIEKVINLAKQLPDASETRSVLSGLLTFTDKFVDKHYAHRIRKEYFMLTQVEQIIYEEAYEEAIATLTESLTESITESLTESITESLTESITESLTESITESTIGNTIQICQELNCTKEQTLKQLIDKFAFSEEAAQGYLSKHWNDHADRILP